MAHFPMNVRNPEGGFITLVAPNMTTDGRTAYGFKWKVIMRLAERWWDKRGRRELKRLQGEWRDPDIGINSGITRGLGWEQLSGRERVSVAHVYEEHHVRAREDVRQAILQYMVDNHPEALNQAELGKFLASLPDADQRAGALLNGET